MADDCARKSLEEWNSIFKKSLGKLSWLYYRSFHLDIAAILLGFKQSLLFDYAVVDSRNALSLAKGFAAEGVIYRSLNVLKVAEDSFFANLKILVNRLRKSVESDEFILIDVSGKLQEPRVLENEIAMRVKAQFINIVEILEQKMSDATSNPVQEHDMEPDTLFVDLGSCIDDHYCIPSVFGFLLGYPVIYWCDKTSEENCLSLVPLNRYTITFKGSPSVLYSRMPQTCSRLFTAGCDKSHICEHIVFSFTAPVALEFRYESKASDWIKKISGLGEELGFAEHLTFKKTIVKLSRVTL